MKYFKLNYIKKKDFNKLEEDNVMFITHPGRMGDEDGSTSIVKKENKFIAYRISGWEYNPDKCEVEYEEMLKAFPEWEEALNHGEKDNYIGKYKYYYMGFGNSLCVDRRISEIFDNHLDKCIKKLSLKINSDDSDPWYKQFIPDSQVISNDYSLKYNSWDEAAYKTAKELNYDIEYTDEETLL